MLPTARRQPHSRRAVGGRPVAKEPVTAEEHTAPKGTIAGEILEVDDLVARVKGAGDLKVRLLGRTRSLRLRSLPQ